MFLYVVLCVVAIMFAIFLAAKSRSLAVGRVRVEATPLLLSSREDVDDAASSIQDVDEFPATDDDYIYIENLVIKGLTDLQCRKEKECKLVSIFGPARQGKSFLLNQLRGSRLFAEQDEILSPGTQGIDVGFPFYIDDLPLGKRSRRSQSQSRDFLVAFVDTEGLGKDRGVADDARVVASLVSLSRVAIFNWLGGVQKDAILQQLGLLLRTFTAMMRDGERQHGRLGYLHIILRDIDGTSADDHVVLGERLLLPELEDHDCAAKERNHIRKMINQLFSGVKVWCMVRPSDQRGDVPDGKSGVFKKQVDKLRAAIVMQLSQKSEPISCGEVGEMLSRCLRDSSLSPQSSSSWSAHQKVAAKDAIITFQEHLLEFSQDLRDRFPIPELQLKEEFSSEAERLRDLLNDSISMIADDDLMTSVNETAVKLLESQQQQALSSNRTVSMEQIQSELLEAKDRVVRRVSEQFQTGSYHVDLDDSVASEEDLITQNCSWIEDENTFRVRTELEQFGTTCINEFQSTITKASEDLLQQKDSEAVAERQAAVERARMLSQEREENQVKLKLEKQEWVDKYKEQKIKKQEWQAWYTEQVKINRNQKEKLDISEDTVIVLARENAELKSQLDVAAQEKGRLSQLYEDNQRDIQILTENLERLQEEKHSLIRVCDRLKVTLQANKQRAQAIIAAQWKNSKDELEKNKVREEHLQQQITTLQETHNQEIRSLNERIRLTEINLLESNHKRRTLEASLEREKNERKDDLETHRMKVRDLKQDHAKDKRQMLSEMEAKKQELARLQKIMENLFDQSRMQKAENDGLMRQTQELEVKIVTIKGQLKKRHMACWQWQDDRHQWQSYDDFTAVQLEEVYTERTGTVILPVGQNWHYEFDLRVMANMTQRNLDTGKLRKLKREEMSITDYPYSWKTQSDDFYLSPVVINTDEYRRIEEQFEASMTGHKIRRIERIQRCYLHHEYQLARERMKIKNEGKVNEKHLFHGTRATNPLEIYRSDNGFDVKFARQGMWGKAIYFAEKASYSHTYSFAMGPPDNCRQMFLATVLTGLCFDDAPTNQLRTRPDFRGDVVLNAQGKWDVCHYRYDSLSGVTRGSRVYVIFDNLHSYPSYLITYSSLAV